MKLSDLVPSFFTDGEDPEVQITTKKYSQFPKVEGAGIEGVGLKDGQNVRFELTTDAIKVNPEPFRNAKGQFIGTPEELAGLENQRDVNNFLYQAISDIEAGDIDLDGYATEEQLAEVNQASEFRDDALNQKIEDESAQNTAAHAAFTAGLADHEDRITELEKKPEPEPESQLEGTLRWVDYTYNSDTIDALVYTVRVHTDRTKMSLNWDTIDDGRKDWADLINDSVGLEVDGKIYWATVEYVGEAGTSGRGKNFKILDHNIPAAGEIAADSITGIWPNYKASEHYATIEYVDDSIAAIEFPETDLSGYLPLSGGEMEGSAQIKVNNIAPVNMSFIYYDGSPSSHPMGLMNRGMISDFIDDKTAGLDDLYVNMTGDTMTGTLNAPRVEVQKLEGGEAVMLVEGKLANNNSAARLTFSNKTNAEAYGSLTWHGQNSDGWFAFNKDLDMNNEGLHSVGRIRLTGEKVICEGNANRILMDNKVVITKSSGNGAGFTVKGKTNAGSNADLLYIYHNSTGLDAVNYAGKQDAASNIATVGYVDNAVSAIPAPEGKKSRISTQVRTMFSTQAAQGKASFIDGNGNRHVRPDDGLGIEYTIARDWSGYKGDKDWWRDDYEPLDSGYIQVIDPFTGKIKWAAGVNEVTRTGDTIRWMISGSIYTNYPDWNPNMDYFLILNGCLEEK